MVVHTHGSTGDAPATRDEFEQAVDDAVGRARSLVDEGYYDAEWDSLARHNEAPEWFRDAKLGVYFTWGPYSVPAYKTEWYPRQMYNEDDDLHEAHRVIDHHVETYGQPDEAPYQDFVPEFTAENFDPEGWADLFVEMGARFAGPIVEHHDGWSNWDSAVNPWNAGDRGPKRDIVGELETAIRDRDLRFITTFHHARTQSYYDKARENYPSVIEGYPEEVLYGNLDKELFSNYWLARIVEVIDDYAPDLIWHDSSLPKIPTDRHHLYLAYYFNRALERDQEVVVTAKGEQLPYEVALEDFEQGRPTETLDRPWLADTSTTVANGWAYTPEDEARSTRSVVHELVDVVSKNGCLLLSFGPRPDGTIPGQEVELMRSIGGWLETHGEAIYGTRPWHTFGEGPNRLEEGGDYVDEVEYTAEDVRYTRSKDGETLYAIVLGWPQSDTLALESVDVENDDGAVVRLLGSPLRADYRVESDGGLTIHVPELPSYQRPSEIAVVFALDGFDLA